MLDRFTGRGAGVEATKRMTENGMVVLRGLAPEDLRELVEEALEPTLLPLVYREALDLAAGHRDRGERTYIVTATLQEIAEALAAKLGFDGALTWKGNLEALGPQVQSIARIVRMRKFLAKQR